MIDMTTITLPSYAVDDLERLYSQEAYDDASLCTRDDNKQATHVFTSQCGSHKPLCLSHAEINSLYLHKHAQEPHRCHTTGNTTIGEHFAVVSL